MARSFHTDLFFDEPVDAVLRLFTHGPFLAEEAVHQGQLRASPVEVERSADSLHLRIDQVGPNRIPGAKPREVPSELHYQWDLEQPGCRWWRVSPHEKGVEVKGRHQLFGTSTGGTRYRMEWELNIKVPVVGRVLEKKAEPAILDGARKREAFARSWLADGRLPPE
jgi:hypothetical protein